MMIKILSGLAASLLAATSVMAQAAPTNDAPVASTREKALDDQIAAYLNASPEALPPAREQAGLLPEGPAPDRAVHGEAGFAIGTQGYREAYASMIAPVGKTGTVAVAVGQVEGRGWYGPRSRQSLSLGLNLGEAGAPVGMLDSCARSRDLRDPEPLWAARLRAQHPGTAFDCAQR